MKTTILVAIIALTALVPSTGGAAESLLQPVIAPAAPAERAATSLRQRAPQTYRQMEMAYNALMRTFWATPGATPQDVAAALGPQGGELFGLGLQLKTFLLSINPEANLFEIPEGYSVAINPDGTAVISYVAP